MTNPVSPVSPECMRPPSAMIGPSPEEGYMSTSRPLLFGFNTPPGDREMGRVNRATFVADQFL